MFVIRRYEPIRPGSGFFGTMPIVTGGKTHGLNLAYPERNYTLIGGVFRREGFDGSVSPL